MGWLPAHATGIGLKRARSSSLDVQLPPPTQFQFSRHGDLHSTVRYGSLEGKTNVDLTGLTNTDLVQGKSEARREAYRSQHSERIVLEGDDRRQRGANDTVTKILQASKPQAHKRKTDEDTPLAPSVSHSRCGSGSGYGYERRVYYKNTKWDIQVRKVGPTPILLP